MCANVPSLSVGKGQDGGERLASNVVAPVSIPVKRVACPLSLRERVGVRVTRP